jgi:hypothetical protein
MSNICQNCNKCFQSKRNLQYHIDHSACKKCDYNCKYCNKQFTTSNSMYRHTKHSCKIKNEEEKEKDMIYGQLMELQKKYDILEHKLNTQSRVKCSKKIYKTINVEKVDTIDNSINKTINNNTINNTLVLVGCGKEDISKIDKNDLIKALKEGYYSTVKLTEAINFNPKYPEYHNVYIPDMKSKYGMKYNGESWELIDKEELIDMVYNKKRDYIEENIEDFVNALSQSRIDALNRWLDTDDNDKKIKLVKNKMKLLLYNKKDIVLECKKI